MDPVHENLIEPNKQNELLKTALQIASGSKSLPEHCAKIRELILNRDTEIRRNALNDFAFIVINLPVDLLSNTENSFLLDFFAARFTDSGHSADLLVTVVHYLVFAQKSYSEEEADTLFHTIFDDNGVQAYVQSDREKLLDIFEFFVKKHFQTVEKMGIQFYTVFANAVGGERDPRCLLKMFSIFVHVMEQIDLGPMMEDVFELVACYWPIEYQPKLTDKNPLTSEVLSAACDACLLANCGFSLYTYQLIAEKLVEDDESAGHDKKLEACKLLSRACQKFGSSSLETFLNDFLAGFRMLCLNPKKHGLNSETFIVIGDTLKILLNTVESDKQNSGRIIKEMATSMLENSEPFVIQPEMGLSTKALGLLERMAVANESVADIILPRVFYWIYVLISGTTVKNQANKEEIIEETLALIPQWFSLARRIDQLDTNQVNILLSGILNMDDFSKTQRIKALCDSLAILLKYDAELSNECTQIVDKTVQFIVENFEEYDEELRLPIFTFISSYASKSFKKCVDLFSSLTSLSSTWNKIQFLICGAFMNGSKELSKFLPIYFEQLAKTEYLSGGTEILLLLFSKLKADNSIDLYDNFVVPLLNYLFALTDTRNERLKLLGIFVQELGLLLDKESHSKLMETCVKHLLKSNGETSVSTVVLLSPVCLQEQSAETHKKIVNTLNGLWTQSKQAELSSYTLAFYFVYQNRNKADCEDIEVTMVEREVKLATKCRSKLLSQPKLPEVELKEVFESASLPALEQLLNFETELTDPAKCDYKKTLMWAQRIVVQLIPFFVEQYKQAQIGDDSAGDAKHKQAMISLIIPLLRLAKRVTIPMVSELELLFPVIVDALYEPNVSQDQLLLLTSATTQLLQLSSNKALSQENVVRITYVLEKLLMSTESSNKAIFAALDVLEVLAKRAKSISQLCRSDQTLCAVRHTIQSKKRVIRQKAALVRGLWEMLPIN